MFLTYICAHRQKSLFYGQTRRHQCGLQTTFNFTNGRKIQFICIKEEYTIKAIENLENKNSSGYNGISNKLLKSIKCSVRKPLTIIINQMITKGIFPDAFKVSKVTPIFKKGDCSLMTNYNPIPLLPAISKIFEIVIHDQMYEYFNEFNLLAE